MVTSYLSTSIIESTPVPQTPQRPQGLRTNDMRPLNPEAPVPDFVNDLSGRETRDGGVLHSVAIVTDEEIARICQRSEGSGGNSGPSASRRPRRAQRTRSRELRWRERQQRWEEERQELLRQAQEWQEQHTIGMQQQQLSPIGPHQRQHTPRPGERLPRSHYFEDFVQESAFGERQRGEAERGGAGNQNWFGGLGQGYQSGFVAQPGFVPHQGRFVWYDGNGYGYGPGYGYEGL